MHENFNDPGDAVAFLSKGLHEDFPDADAEVIWFFKDQARQATCPVAKIDHILGRMCRKFPKASVEYRPDHPYGFVAEIQCHGEMNRKRETAFTRRNDRSPRARVVVLLRRVHHEDLLVGASRAPRQTHTVAK